MSIDLLQPHTRVRVIQRIRTREASWETLVEGRVLECEPKPTGSWFARGRDGRVWLVRLRLEKEDGETVDLVLDSASTVETVAPAPPDAPS